MIGNVVAKRERTYQRNNTHQQLKIIPSAESLTITNQPTDNSVTVVKKTNTEIVTDPILKLSYAQIKNAKAIVNSGEESERKTMEL